MWPDSPARERERSRCDTELTRTTGSRLGDGWTMGAQDAPVARRTLKRNEAQEGAGLSTSATAAEDTRPERWSNASKPALRARSLTRKDLRKRNRSREAQGSRRTAGRQATAVTRHALSTGISSKGDPSVAGTCRIHLAKNQGTGTETRRTPGSAAGCNKPATDEAEETIEVVRNHEDGTGLRGWSPRGRSASRPLVQEWTLRTHVDEGEHGTSSRSRARLCGRKPRREGGHLA